MRAYDTVLFDLDGTLLNTLDDLKDSVNFILERHGCPTWEERELRSFLGNGLRRLMELSVPGGMGPLLQFPLQTPPDGAGFHHYAG